MSLSVDIAPPVIQGPSLDEVVRWLRATHPECTRMLREIRQQRRTDRVQALALRSHEMLRLLRSVHEVGLEVEAAGENLAMLGTGDSSVVVAQSDAGLRLVGSRENLDRILEANSASRALEHLRTRGFDVEVARGSRGEITLHGRRPDHRTVRVQVGHRGDARVETRHFRGKECGGFARDLAAALEGSITRFEPTDEYHRPSTEQRGRVDA